MFHFLPFNHIPQLWPQLCNAFNSSWNRTWSWMVLMDWWIKQSSAKMRTSILGTITDGKSLMNDKNNKGTRTMPCGTQEWTWALSNVYPSSIIACMQSCRNAQIRWATSPSILHILSLLRSQTCGTLSNTLAKSKTPTSTWFLARWGVGVGVGWGRGGGWGVGGWGVLLIVQSLLLPTHSLDGRSAPWDISVYQWHLWGRLICDIPYNCDVIKMHFLSRGLLHCSVNLMSTVLTNLSPDIYL